MGQAFSIMIIWKVAAVLSLFGCLANARVKPQGLIPGPPTGSGPQSNFIRGEESEPHSHPSVVWINGWGVCIGHLISDQYVVTTAQCVNRADEATLLFGAHDRTQSEPEQTTVTSTEFVVHEYFHPNTFINDIALIKLPQPNEFTSAIQAIELPSYDINDGDTALLSGWGQITASDPNYSDVLMEGEITVSSTSDCDHYYGKRRPKTVCVMTDTGSAPFCQGDFGGGLYKDGAVHGVASFYSAAGCDSGGGDVYTRIYSYVDWIREHTGL